MKRKNIKMSNASREALVGERTRIEREIDNHLYELFEKYCIEDHPDGGDGFRYKRSYARIFIECMATSLLTAIMRDIELLDGKTDRDKIAFIMAAFLEKQINNVCNHSVSFWEEEEEEEDKKNILKMKNKKRQGESNENGESKN